ncbi:hypothetical protein [Spartinivicinus ruber]|uniref:hypothetical protein n=1 Tax=Spartinivicinus ruber TaxID=2683272 RepID=UPI0013D6FF1B|nr:hypothetical protein [Spartinivicinus ruber]
MDWQHDSISATELARNMASVIDKVRVSGHSVYITKGSQTIAELSPPPKQGFPIEQLGSLLASLPSLGNDAQQMAEDLKAARSRADLPENPWD